MNSRIVPDATRAAAGSRPLVLALAAALASPLAGAQALVGFTPDPLPTPVVNVPYATTAAGNGGIAPYVFISTAGRLPQGLALSPSGSIAGTPTRSGPFALNLTVIDGNGRQATRSLTGEVDAGVPRAVPQSVTLLEDGSRALILDAVDLNDAALTFALAPGGAPLHGVLQGAMPTVVYQAAPDYNGGDVFLYTASDGSNTSDPAQVTLAILPVNDAPQFAAGEDVVALRGSGPVVLPGWATMIAAGPANEAGQALQFVVTANTRPALFSVAPGVAPDGTLTFTPSGGAGTASITLELRDDGGVANGGVDRSAPRFFSISLQSPGTDLSVHIEAAAAYVDNAPLQFTVRVENAGPSTATDAAVDVLLPPQLTSVQWTCVPAAPATCSAAGSGDIADTVTIPANGSVAYTVQAQVVANGIGQFAVEAQVAPGTGQVDPDPSDDTDRHVFRADAIFSDGFED